MKLLTLNCHSWLEEDQIEKIKILAETIKENSYDIIALQEVSQSIDAENIDGLLKEDNFLLILLDELSKIGVKDYQYTWDFSHIGFDIYEEGLAIISKHPIEEKFSFFVTQSEDTSNWKTRKIVGAKISYKDEPISFYSCHLGWWGDEEEPYKGQVNALYEHAYMNEKFVLMGDFNNAAHVKEEGYDYLLSKGLYDTYDLSEVKDSGTTVKGKIVGWDENTMDLRIDYIFSSFPIEVKKSNTIFNGINKPIISDHYGLEIEACLK